MGQFGAHFGDRSGPIWQFGATKMDFFFSVCRLFGLKKHECVKLRKTYFGIGQTCMLFQACVFANFLPKEKCTLQNAIFFKLGFFIFDSVFYHLRDVQKNLRPGARGPFEDQEGPSREGGCCLSVVLSVSAEGAMEWQMTC